MRLSRTMLRGLIVATTLTLSMTALSTAQVAVNDNRTDASVPGISIENFGRVNENYYRGGQPKGHDYNDLAKLGIKTVLDLQIDGETREQSLVEAAGMKFFRIGMNTHDKPTATQAETFLKIVNDPSNQPVYVHCHGGRHRTGTMTAVYRMNREGWSADRAFQEMKQYEFTKGFGHGALKAFVYEYGNQMEQAHSAPSGLSRQ